jgi:Zn-dependent M28 family amino/carboxypeptidase
MDQITPLKIGVVILLSGIPFMIALFFFLGRDAVPGAIDNLTAVGVCMGIAKYLKDLPKAEAEKIFSELEVVILLTGSEEAGDRGAEAFARAHAAEYNQIDTTVVNMESLSDSAMQKIVTKELTTNTVCTPKIYNLLAECAKELGINYKLQELPAIAGGTDCAGFFKGGLQVSGLEGIRYKDYLNWYHSDKDNLAIIHTEKRENSDSGTDYKTLNVRGAMVNCFKICVKYLEKLA